MVRVTDIIALAAIGIVGFVLRDRLQGVFDFFSDPTGAGAVTENVTGALSTVGESVGNFVSPAIQGPVQQEVVSQSFTQVPPEQRTPFDALGAGLGGLFAGIGNLFNTNPASVGPDPRVDGNAIPFGPALPQPESLSDFVNRFSQPQAPTPVVAEPLTIQSGIEGQQFLGGNIGGFVGGNVQETPIANLSLGQIIDRFNVTASQAANIQATAQNNFGDFDFGSNTGGGIGSVVTQPDINPQFSGGNVSNPEFEGLSPAEIARRLTGGIISNF